MQNVAKSARRDHTDVGALALDDHVGRDRGPVQDHVDIAGRNAGDLADFDNALHDANGLVRWRRRHLVHENSLARAAAGLLQDDVSKRPSDVDADTYHSRSPLLFVTARLASADQRPNALCVSQEGAMPCGRAQPAPNRVQRAGRGAKRRSQQTSANCPSMSLTTVLSG
jgi:hypothetical protein